MSDIASTNTSIALPMPMPPPIPLAQDDDTLQEADFLKGLPEQIDN